MRCAGSGAHLLKMGGLAPASPTGGREVRRAGSGQASRARASVRTDRAKFFGGQQTAVEGRGHPRGPGSGQPHCPRWLCPRGQVVHTPEDVEGSRGAASGCRVWWQRPRPHRGTQASSSSRCSALCPGPLHFCAAPNSTVTRLSPCVSCVSLPLRCLPLCRGCWPAPPTVGEPRPALFTHPRFCALDCGLPRAGACMPNPAQLTGRPSSPGQLASPPAR